MRMIISICFVVLQAIAFAQNSTPTVRLRGEAEAGQTRNRIIEAQQKLLAGKHAEAAADLQRIIDEFGDDLIQVKGDNYQPARRIAHQALGSLPLDALKTLRDRLEEPARKLFLEGKRTRDPSILNSVVAKYFVSRPAEDALLLLAELAFERGDFATAQLYWNQLLPSAEPGVGLHYPAPETKPEIIIAQKIQAQIFAGELLAARSSFEQFRKAYPKATGRLAGSDGPYAETLAKLLADPPQLEPEAGSSAWPTFGGSANRAGHGSETLPLHWPSLPSWRTKIPRDASDSDTPRPSGIAASRSLAFHPVILGDFAYIADAARVFSLHLKTGEARIAFDFRSVPGPHEFEPEELALTVSTKATYSLTVANGKIYARLGAPAMPGAEAGPKNPITELLALEPIPTPNLPAKALSLKASWRVRPPLRDTETGAWQGAPLHADGKLYAAFVRITRAGKLIHAIAAYSDSEGTTPIWTADLAEADANQPEAQRQRHDLLTLAGPNIVFTTHTGLTIAVNRTTSKPAWAWRNSNAIRPSIGAHRDLSPPIYSQGKIFIAPADGEGITALNAEDGRFLWQSPALQIEQMLGVSANKIIATISAPQKGIRGFDINTGSDEEPNGWKNHDDPFLASYGRGIVSDGLILWPTREKLYFVRATDGSIARQPIAGPHGNLAFGNGVLLVASANEVWGYRMVEDEPEMQGLAPREQAERIHEIAERARATGRIAEAERELKTVFDSTLPAALRAQAYWELSRTNAAPSGRVPQEIVEQWITGPLGIPTRFDRQFKYNPPPDPVLVPLPRTAPPDPAVALPALNDSAVIASQTMLTTLCLPLQSLGNSPDDPGMERTIPIEHQHVVLATGKKLIAYKLNEQKPNWEAPIGFGITHGKCLDNGLLIASGARGIIALQLIDGKRIWQFIVPELAPDLSVPVLSEKRIIVSFGKRTVLALDLEHGRVLWHRNAYNRDRVEHIGLDSAPTFSPFIGVNEDIVLLQRSDGRILALDAATGKILFTESNALAHWQCAPVSISKNRMVHANEPGQIRAVETRPMNTRWRYRAEGEASLTGALSTFRFFNDMLLTATSRNYGIELDRIDPETGKSYWRRGPRLFLADALALDACDADRQVVYVPENGKLSAIRREDGRLSWEVKLPELQEGNSWRVRVGRSGLILHATHAQPEEAWNVVRERLHRRFLEQPSVENAIGMSFTMLAAWSECQLPILFLDRETGRELRRIELPTIGTNVKVHLLAGTSAVISQGGITWLKNQK